MAGISPYVSLYPFSLLFFILCICVQVSRCSGHCAIDWMPTSRSLLVYWHTVVTMNCLEEAWQQLVAANNESDEEQDWVEAVNS